MEDHWTHTTQGHQDGVRVPMVSWYPGSAGPKWGAVGPLGFYHTQTRYIGYWIYYCSSVFRSDFLMAEFCK